MNILDSSAWIEVFQRGPNFDKFILVAKNLETLLLPTIVIYEVVKFITIWGT